jgi:indolepyruvate ferredoxin oxidoreductase alpha subunit
MQQSNLSSSKLLLSGNEAVALGALHGGVRLAAAYPGTPSTEILETIAARHPEIYAEWAPNEKVALEVGIGAAFGGARVLVTMKHVGLNVAADPLFTLAYTGTKGGIVIVSADDPGMHSSQNEQDNRNYGPFAKVPVFEPADSQEAYEFVRQALQVSEDFDTPVILRMTTRVCHGKSIVVPTEPVQLDREMALDRDQAKYVMVPAYAKRRQVVVHERTAKLAEWAETAPINSETAGTDGKRGIVTAGVAYQYVREVLPEASILKLGMLHPLRRRRSGVCLPLRERFCPRGTRYVSGNPPAGDGVEHSGQTGALPDGGTRPDRVRDIFGIAHPSPASPENIPPRPPVLCPAVPTEPPTPF